MWLFAAIPQSGIPYVQMYFIIDLQICSLFSMLSLDFLPVSHDICLLFNRIFEHKYTDGINTSLSPNIFVSSEDDCKTRFY